MILIRISSATVGAGLSMVSAPTYHTRGPTRRRTPRLAAGGRRTLDTGGASAAGRLALRVRRARNVARDAGGRAERGLAGRRPATAEVKTGAGGAAGEQAATALPHLTGAPIMTGAAALVLLALLLLLAAAEPRTARACLVPGAWATARLWINTYLPVIEAVHMPRSAQPDRRVAIDLSQREIRIREP